MFNPNQCPLFNSEQVSALRSAIYDHPNEEGLFARSLSQLQARIAAESLRSIDVPDSGEAGSYQHNKHKSNAEVIEAAGLLYLLTGNADDARLAADILIGYAQRYPTMPYHPQKNTNPPGRLFHQILNEHMWLLFAALGYSYIKATLSESQQRAIEDDLFYPMLEMFTVTYGHDFDRIHNHGVWAVAAVGICGLVLDEQSIVDQCIYGLNGDGVSGGFLAQINHLFSPAGYYVEGPYYHRFAIRPLCLFAEALNLHRPELDIYNVKDQVIRKTINALLMTAYPNGCFPALNDASSTMNISDDGVVTAVAVCYARYGHSDNLVATARQQGHVWLHPCAIELATQADRLNAQSQPHWPSVELNEGMEGDRGAQGFLRGLGSDGDLTQVAMNYGQHGMGHGHFDTLGLTLFNRGQEVLREYGFGRWVNVETKFGGRYLDENKSWARQTVAHNTVVVDQRCQNDFDCDKADNHHGVPHFFAGNQKHQGMSAFANSHYGGVDMQRTVLLLSLDELEFPLLVDLYRLKSEKDHQYDYTVHYQGQITHTNVDYSYRSTQRNVLGDSNGYQHLFEVARGGTPPSLSLTWLQGQRFNTWISAASNGELIFAQTGANDPSFNLRHEDCLLLRKQSSVQLFASAFETHGFFDEATERCEGARGAIEHIEVIGHSDEASVVSITGTSEGKPLSLLVMISNRPDVTRSSENSVVFSDKHYRWQGYFAVKTNPEN